MLDKKSILDRLDIRAYYAGELPSLKLNGSSKAQALCPYHDDKQPSLSIDLETGVFHCFGCDKKGSIFDFYMARNGVDFSAAKQALADRAGLTSEARKTIKTAYDYTDEAGNLLFQTVRYEPKDFRQRRPDGKGGWIWKLENIRLVPFNLPEVIKAKSVCIAEGEKDVESLKALGLTASCNPMGAGKWRPEYNEHFKGKRVAILPDNDEPGRKHAHQVAQALKGLAESVRVVELPSLPIKGDVSDWIERGGGTKETLIELIKQAPEWESSKGTNNKKTKEQEPEITASFPGLVDIALNENGQVVFLIKQKDALEIATAWEIDGRLYIPPDREHLPYALPRAKKILEHYKTLDDKSLFSDVLAYLKRFSYLPFEQWLIVACNVFLTYSQDHPEINYMAMLLFWAVPERGKSRTGKAVTYISYRGVHIIDLREANLFRYSENLSATLFLDLMDLWKKAERNNSEDILLLRYEKGARVARVLYPEKGAFNDTKYYKIFGPTLIATNEPVHKILDTRCIPITMPNKPGNYENPTPEKALELKERLTAWRARVMDMVLPQIETFPGISGRLWDISKPLLQICKLVSPGHLEDLKDALLDVAGTRLDDKRESIEGKIIGIIKDLAPEDLPDWELPTAAILERLNQGRPPDRPLNAQWLGKKLTSMGLSTRKSHGTKIRRIERLTFESLLIQYGFVSEISPLSPKSPNQGMTPLFKGDSSGDSCQSPPQSPPPQTRMVKPSGDIGDISTGTGTAIELTEADLL